MHEIYMEKTNVNGKRQFYKYQIDGNTVICTWGQINGKIQEEPRTFTEGKNIGKKNEKTPEQCCLEDTVTRARKKYEGGYELLKGKEMVLDNLKENIVLADTEIPLPMLAKKYREQRKKVDDLEYIYVQPKINGNRGLISLDDTKAYSRSRKEISHFPEIVEEIVRATKDAGLPWPDGEFYTPGLTFNDLQTIMRRTKNLDKPGTAKIRAMLKFYIFDFAADVPWEERMAALDKVKDSDRVVVVPTHKIHPSEIETYHNQFVAEGYEGIMIRIPGKHYEHKKGSVLLKHKNFEDDEFPVVGFESEKHNANKLGKVILEMPNGDTFSALPSMTASEKQDIWDNQDEYLGRLATIRYQELDAKTSTPIFGTLKAFRLPEDMDE